MNGQVMGDETARRVADMLANGFIETFERRHSQSILQTLLCDRTTGKNIIWADGEYEALGSGYEPEDEITCEAIAGLHAGIIKPRVLKAQEQQSKRTKARAEVFSPAWLVNEMCNAFDGEWFGRSGVFTSERDGAWETNPDKVEFPSAKGRGWHSYVNSTRLEITCGEAPFLCTRYDAVTGGELPVCERVGVLDRKLRVVSERTQNRKSWIAWALNALRATYGYEYQGDNLLIARINCLETFVEHHVACWGEEPKEVEVLDAARIVSWNLWQMNGLTCAVPTTRLDAPVQSTLCGYEMPEQGAVQLTLFDLFDELDEGDWGSVASAAGDETNAQQDGIPLCVIYDWENDQPVEFSSMKGEVGKGMKKFYAVIGNPPYQEEFTDEGNKTYAAPIYNSFMDAAEQVADKVELITPARFLFDAGSTPKAWNRKKLNDPHFKVLRYEEDASKVFPNTDIKGGVAITLKDGHGHFGALEVFTKYPSLTSVLQKVRHSDGFTSMTDVAITRTAYRLTDKLHEDYPQVAGMLSKGHAYDMATNIFDRIPMVFHNTRPDDGSDYIRILGREGNVRVYKYIRAEYVNEPDNLYKYKVFLPSGNGNGKYGEVLTAPVLSGPGVGATETFISVGLLDSFENATFLLEYIKTKFVRGLLGVLKITQHLTPAVWSYVPLQDFTSSSDIDWSQSVADIDQQLYRKYGLSQDEIDFIESHVKEMK